MNLPKAIEILTFWEDDLNAWNIADIDTAIKLGIEAMNRLSEWRQGRIIHPFALLTSETES